MTKPKRTILVAVRLTEQEATALRKMAQQMRRTPSWMVAEAIRKMVGLDADNDDGEKLL
jgi:predicted transcriptional regulator